MRGLSRQLLFGCPAERCPKRLHLRSGRAAADPCRQSIPYIGTTLRLSDGLDWLFAEPGAERLVRVCQTLSAWFESIPAIIKVEIKNL